MRLSTASGASLASNLLKAGKNSRILKAKRCGIFSLFAIYKHKNTTSNIKKVADLLQNVEFGKLSPGMCHIEGLK